MLYLAKYRTDFVMLSNITRPLRQPYYDSEVVIDKYHVGRAFGHVGPGYTHPRPMSAFLSAGASLPPSPESTAVGTFSTSSGALWCKGGSFPHP